MPSIEVSEQRGVRYLHFGSPWIQGAMRIARPWSLELEYTRELMLPLLLRPADFPRRVLQAGLGAASVTRFLHRHRPAAKVTVVEILPEVVAVARQHFRLPPESPHLRIVVADAYEHLHRGGARQDLIVVDGFDEKGRAGALDTVPFYAACRARLAAGGFLAVNLLTRRRSAAPSLLRMREAFDGRVLELPPSDAGNVVAIAASADEPPASYDTLHAAARTLRESTGLDLRPTLARLRARGGAGVQFREG